MKVLYICKKHSLGSDTLDGNWERFLFLTFLYYPELLKHGVVEAKCCDCESTADQGDGRYDD
jgi:hypothetical protein